MADPFNFAQMQPLQGLSDPVGVALGKYNVSLPKLVAKSKHEPGLGPDGKIAADLTYGDYSAERIKQLRWLFKTDFMEYTPAWVYFIELRMMASTFFSTGDLNVNIQHMIDRFEASTGADYSSDALDKAVRAHERYIKFREEFNNKLSIALAQRKGDLSKLISNLDIKMESPLLFNTLSDKVRGLTIAINDVWAWRIEITQYQLAGNIYSGKYRVMLFDHFGLDEPDVDTSKIYGNLVGFRAWFILQHYTRFAYKPFMTKVVLEESFSGIFS